ncbi:MAG: sulfatase family protein [Pirellulales bacterium]
MIYKSHLLLSLLCCTFFLFTTQAKAATPAPPNILFIVSEDNGPEIGCYGSPVETPYLDKLASHGTLFKNAYVPQAGCSQSRAAFLTGLYPHQNGQIGLATWKYEMYRSDWPNVVTTLKQARYCTGILGKLHINPQDAFPFDMKAISDANFSRKQMARYADKAAEFFSASDRPFYLQVNYPDAHRPFITQVNGIPKNPLTGRDVDALPYMGINTSELKQQTADYYNCMMRLDTHIGQLLEALEKSGKQDQTVVVYIGDHGADLLRGKRTSYEGGLKIPMIVRWPNQVKGQVRNELVSTLDLFPTFCEIAGVTPPNNLPGKSLRPLVQGLKPKWRQYLFTEYHVHSNHNPWPQRTVRGQRYKLIHNPVAGQVNPGYQFTISKFIQDGEESMLQGASAQVKKAYALMKQPPEFELYDLETDPFEFNNLAEDAKHTDQLSHLQQKLKTWQSQTGDALADPKKAERLIQLIQTTGTKRELIPYREFMQP